jgi:hypothetical protein
MSFVKKIARSSNPLKPKFSNPISAALDEKSRGGDTASTIGAAFDPGELMGNNRTMTAKENADWLADAKKKSKKRKGMKKGGSTNKCGVGGYYRKRG